MRLVAVPITLAVACTACRPSNEVPDTPPPGKPPQAEVAVVEQDGAPVDVARLAEPFALMRDSAVAAIRRDSGTAKADSMLAQFRSRYRDAIDDWGSSLWDNTSFQGLLADSAAADSVARLLASQGFLLSWSEGGAYPSEDSGMLLAQAGKYVSVSMKSFLALRQHDESEPLSDDAALLIPWDSVGQRLAAWQAFANAHPDFVLRPEALAWRDTYASIYLTGLDNSRVFEDTLRPNVRASYERFVQRHRGTIVGDLVAGYLQVLATSGFRLAPAVTQYLESHGVKSFLGVQPPIR